MCMQCNMIVMEDVQTVAVIMTNDPHVLPYTMLHSLKAGLSQGRTYHSVLEQGRKQRKRLARLCSHFHTEKISLDLQPETVLYTT